jgi:energy-coupling factor transporter ATP-binding protein EcfA2
MAHIIQFWIDGLLGRPEQIHYCLNRKVNAFFGANGCGKTTLLKVLNAALESDDDAMERMPVTKATVEIYSMDSNSIYTHTWERKTLPEPPEKIQRPVFEHRPERGELVDFFSDFLPRRRTPNSWEITPERTEGTRKWMHTFLPTTRLYLSTPSQSRSAPSVYEMSESQLDQSFNDAVNRTWLRFYSRTLTEIRNIQQRALTTSLWRGLSANQKHAIPPINNSVEVYNSVKRFLQRQTQANDSKETSVEQTLGTLDEFRNRYNNEPALRQIVNTLADLESKIQATESRTNSFLHTIERLFSGQKKLRNTENELHIELSNGDKLPLSNLSSGEKQLIRILLSVMTAGPNTILIDEPELSMHIDWQREFVSTIQSLNEDCQLIIASHSPEVLAEISDDCIFKL